jgi:hypothetical protein
MLAAVSSILDSVRVIVTLPLTFAGRRTTCISTSAPERSITDCLKPGASIVSRPRLAETFSKRKWPVSSVEVVSSVLALVESTKRSIAFAIGAPL